MRKLKLSFTLCGVLMVLTTVFLLSTSHQTSAQDVDAQSCKTCHSEFVEYKEWETSAHAEALEGLKSSDHAGDSCLDCHSADYRVAPEGEKPTLETAKESLSCATCHKHDTGLEHNLPVDKAEVCVECHTTEEAEPGESVHHPQEEMFTGLGHTMTLPSGHTKTLEDRCVECHMYKEDEEVVTEAGGHTFEPNLEACERCHANPEDTKERVQTEISNMLDAIQVRLENATDQESEDYQEAKFNYDMVNADGSLGVHNYPYAKALLNRSISLLGGVPTAVSPDGKLAITWGEVKSE